MKTKKAPEIQMVLIALVQRLFYRITSKFKKLKMHRGFLTMNFSVDIHVSGITANLKEP